MSVAEAQAVVVNDMTSLIPVPPEIGDVCQRCHQRPSTQIIADSVIGHNHGFYEVWCEHCALTTALEYAQAAAARIPELEAKLAASR
jgi:hypothetical protein